MARLSELRGATNTHWSKYLIEDATPCPFCGEPYITIERPSDVPHLWRASCASMMCMAEGPLAGTPKEAMAKWEQRDNQSKEE